MVVVKPFTVPQISLLYVNSSHCTDPAAQFTYVGSKHAVRFEDSKHAL